jgi:hypothetical protein
MSKRPITHWTVHELNKTVAKKFEAAVKCQPGPKRQKLLREAKRYKNPAGEENIHGLRRCVTSQYGINERSQGAATSQSFETTLRRHPLQKRNALAFLLRSPG